MNIRAFALVLSLISLSVGSSQLAADPSATNEIDSEAFYCIRDMTPVRGFYVDNLSGDLKATLAAASAPDGAVYPEGSLVQLVPGEAMVKLSAGASPATNDWEFFELDVSPEGTAIRKRGFADVVNRFGGNCLDCHAKAEARWDMICETGHGCDPIPLTRDMLVLLQKTDPRCENNPSLTAEEIATLQALRQAATARN
ncbi:hypothetical protein EY643_15710 [Halioglobus maricola]|uniref:Cytochrome c domain-containing protein n=1 Tax=Halioglobus maricola TaxID=2601894 RepID=A0A5P9NMX3_9GAMM|nr:hypothetical protein [Halioglobus maricola]QFU76979.1 hypothetical protein EY643_15710 [Halioglobus maricola]